MSFKQLIPRGLVALTALQPLHSCCYCFIPTPTPLAHSLPRPHDGKAGLANGCSVDCSERLLLSANDGHQLGGLHSPYRVVVVLVLSLVYYPFL